MEMEMEKGRKSRVTSRHIMGGAAGDFLAC